MVVTTRPIETLCAQLGPDLHELVRLRLALTMTAMLKKVASDKEELEQAIDFYTDELTGSW